MNVKIISAILALALASMACGFSIDLPERQDAGPDLKESITVADPKSDETRLTIAFGAGELTLSPGAQNLVDGTVVYNVAGLKPEVKKDGSSVEIKQGNFDGMPQFDGTKNKWDLQLGKMPMDLTIEAGAYSGKYELGGLALRSLTIQDGAAEVNLSFSEPNPVEMSELHYATGASDVKLTGLANANFSTLDFDGGAGSYTLDFSGELQRDATVNIDSGLSSLDIIIPSGVNAVVTVDSGLSDIKIGEGWSQKGSVYSQEGSGPTLTILINIGAGSVTLKE